GAGVPPPLAGARPARGPRDRRLHPVLGPGRGGVVQSRDVWAGVGARLHYARAEDPDRLPGARRLVRDPRGAGARRGAARDLDLAPLAPARGAAAAPRRPE